MSETAREKWERENNRGQAKKDFDKHEKNRNKGFGAKKGSVREYFNKLRYKNSPDGKKQTKADGGVVESPCSKFDGIKKMFKKKK